MAAGQAQVSSTSGVEWLLSDYQGSVRQVRGLTGTLVDSIRYDAFGNATNNGPASGVASLVGFQGMVYDAVTGQNVTTAREYDPATGRWNRVDPIGFAGGQSNLYEFVNNGPTDATDPSGLQRAWPVGRPLGPPPPPLPLRDFPPPQQGQRNTQQDEVAGPTGEGAVSPPKKFPWDSKPSPNRKWAMPEEAPRNGPPRATYGDPYTKSVYATPAGQPPFLTLVPYYRAKLNEGLQKGTVEYTVELDRQFELLQGELNDEILGLSQTYAEMSLAWHGNWKERMLSRLQTLGYTTLTAFLADNPAVPYLVIADILGKDDVSAFQVGWLHYEEAVAQGILRATAMDSIVRDIAEKLPDGWKAVSVGDFKTAGVYSRWINRMEEYAGLIEPIADAVWDALKAENPPAGWKPKGPDDPYIIRAFKTGWPEGIDIETKIVPRPNS